MSSTTRVSADWYAEAIRDVAAAWPDLRDIRVFSDGSDSELAPILSLPSVQRVPKRPAITDLLDLANATVLIAAPQSTFSMWAKFLGDPLVISLPVADEQRFGVRYEILEGMANARKAAISSRVRDHLHQWQSSRVGRTY